jgi:hypothetical protein
MVLSIPISAETETRLRELADAAGADVTEYVSRIIEETVARPAIDEVLAPLRREFAQSGTTDEELREEIVQARRAFRADQRKRPG